MASNYYIVITVAYDRPEHCQGSLERIAPELRNAGLTIAGHRAGLSGPSRTWAGVVDRRTLAELSRAWRLNGADALWAAGGPAVAGRAWTLDGMNWEVDGDSPIVYVQVEVRDASHGDDGREQAAAGTGTADAGSMRSSQPDHVGVY